MYFNYVQEGLAEVWDQFAVFRHAGGLILFGTFIDNLQVYWNNFAR